MWEIKGDFRDIVHIEGSTRNRGMHFDNTSETAVIKEVFLTGRTDGAILASVTASSPAAYQRLLVVAGKHYSTSNIDRIFYNLNFNSKNKLLIARFLKTIQAIEPDFAMIVPELTRSLGVDLAKLVLPIWLINNDYRPFVDPSGAVPVKQIAFEHTPRPSLIKVLSVSYYDSSRFIGCVEAPDWDAYRRLAQATTQAGFRPPVRWEYGSLVVKAVIDNHARLLQFLQAVKSVVPDIEYIESIIATKMNVDLTGRFDMPLWKVTEDEPLTSIHEGFFGPIRCHYENLDPAASIKALTLLTHDSRDMHIMVTAVDALACQRLLLTITQHGLPASLLDLQSTNVNRFSCDDQAFLTTFIQAIKAVESGFPAIEASVSRVLNIKLTEVHATLPPATGSCVVSMPTVRFNSMFAPRRDESALDSAPAASSSQVPGG